MKSWRANWSDTVSPEPETKSHSDDEHTERSPKRRRMNPTGLTSEIQAFEIHQSKAFDKPVNNPIAKETVVKDTKPVVKGDDGDKTTPPDHKEQKTSGVHNTNCSPLESPMDGSFVEPDNIDQHVGDTVGHRQDSRQHEELYNKKNSRDIYVPGGSHYESCGDNVTGEFKYGKSTDTPQSLFYSCSSEVQSVSNVSCPTRSANVNSTRETHRSPENSLMTTASSSFVTPARSSREPHSRQYTGEKKGKVFRTPASSAPKHFQTASVQRIKFQTPMDMSSHTGQPRSCNTTPRRRHNHVSTMTRFDWMVLNLHCGFMHAPFPYPVFTFDIGNLRLFSSRTRTYFFVSK